MCAHIDVGASPRCRLRAMFHHVWAVPGGSCAGRGRLVGAECRLHVARSCRRRRWARCRAGEVGQGRPWGGGVVSVRGSPVGDGDVPVHRYRGFDAPVGGRSRGDARRRWRRTTTCCGRRSRPTAAGCSSTPGTGCARRSRRLGAAVDGGGARRSGGWGCRCGWASRPARRRSADGDYFGPALNRAARVMAAGHGGQILVAASTAALVDGRRAGRSGRAPAAGPVGVEHLFQVRADGLASSVSRRCGRWTRCRGTCRCRRPASSAATSR